MENGKKEAYAYINQYQKQKYDRITILRKSGEKEQLTKMSKALGYRTLTEFINSCIDERIEKLTSDQPTQAPETPTEPINSEKAKYLPLTPENIAKVDLDALIENGNTLYQAEVAGKFGMDGLNKFAEMAKAKKSRG